MLGRVRRWSIAGDARRSPARDALEDGVVLLEGLPCAALIDSKLMLEPQPRCVRVLQEALIAEAPLVGDGPLDDEARALARRVARRFVLDARQRSAEASESVHDASLTLWLAREDEFVVAHAGDIRALLIRERSVISLTEVHDELRRAEHPRWAHARRGRLILNAIGGRAATIDTALEARREGDRVVLCSDGVYQRVEDDEIAELVTDRSASDAVDALLQRAIERGSRDDVSAVVAHAYAGAR